MKGEKTYGAVPMWALRPEVRQAVKVAFWGLVLAVCLILPMVGKAAVHGSGSPGAGPMSTVWKNHLFFEVVLLSAVAVGGVASWLEWKAGDGRKPKGLLWVLGVCIALAVCHWTGLLGI